jgi:hypothetical protein
LNEYINIIEFGIETILTVSITYTNTINNLL